MKESITNFKNKVNDNVNKKDNNELILEFLLKNLNLKKH
jgi:hypothetical protein